MSPPLRRPANQCEQRRPKNNGEPQTNITADLESRALRRGGGGGGGGGGGDDDDDDDDGGGGGGRWQTAARQLEQFGNAGGARSHYHVAVAQRVK